MGEKQEFGRYKTLNKMAEGKYSALRTLYNEHGMMLLEKVRLAKNFERYCNAHTVRWGVRQKASREGLPGFGEDLVGAHAGK